jgi:hypothetical protein
VLAGYVAGRVAKTQPLLHGALAGVLGAVLIAFTQETVFAIVIWSLIYISGSVAGGWLYRKWAANAL